MSTDYLSIGSIHVGLEFLDSGEQVPFYLNMYSMKLKMACDMRPQWSCHICLLITGSSRLVNVASGHEPVLNKLLLLFAADGLRTPRVT